MAGATHRATAATASAASAAGGFAFLFVLHHSENYSENNESKHGTYYYCNNIIHYPGKHKTDSFQIYNRLFVLFVSVCCILLGSVYFNVNCELVGFFVTFEEKHINRNSNESNGNYETEYIYFYIVCEYSAYIVDNK